MIDIVMSKRISISRKGRSFEVEQLKRCSTSLGYTLYLFRNLDVHTRTHDPYIVAVKNAANETVEFLFVLNIKLACQYYVDFICCYA